MTQPTNRMSDFMAKLFALLDGLTERGLLTDIGGFVPGDWEREVTMFRDLAKDNKIDGDDLEAAKEDVYVKAAFLQFDIKNPE